MSFKSIGRYEVIKELGRGGMATVYIARDPSMNRQVAIKLLPQELAHDPNFRARFEREARTVAGLEHSSIVPVYDYGEIEGQSYFVMRLMTGGALSDRLAKGALPIEQTITILKRIAQGLDYAHTSGIIHRDLKPANILFDQLGEPYLSDFGIAKLAESGATLTGNAIIGTPAYMSPEQGRGETDVDARSDIYSLGVVMFEMLTGRIPFEADTPMGQVVKHMTAPLPFLADIDGNLPPQLQSVINRAMAKRKLTRYATAGEMVADLEAAAAGRLNEAAFPVSGSHAPVAGQPKTSAAPATPRPHAPGMVGGPATPRPTRIVTPVSTPRSAAPPPPPDLAATTIQPAKKRSPVGAIVGVIVVLALLGVGAVWGLPLVGINLLPAAATKVAAAPTDTNAPESTEGGSQPAAPTAQPTATPEPTEAGAVVQPPTPTVEPEATATQSVTPLKPGPVIGGADLVAFVKENDIWIANLDASDVKRLTTTGGTKEGLNWSPDGQSVIYVAGRCIQSVNIFSMQVDSIVCFNWAEYVSSFAVSPDGKYVAISLSDGLFIFPYNLSDLRQIKRRDQLIGAAACAKYTETTTKVVRWSSDSKFIAVVLVVTDLGRKVDLIREFNVGTCGVSPVLVDSFPGVRFTIPGFATKPVIETFGWDGDLVFAMHINALNGFGPIYTYNTNTKNDAHISPLYTGKTERCCYRDLVWSPDGDFFMFLFQDNLVVTESELYYISYGTIGTGQTYAPLPFEEGFFKGRTEKLYPALRPALQPGQ